MVDEVFRVDPKKVIEALFSKGPRKQRLERNVPHGIDAPALQFSGNARTYPPEIRQWPMVPQLLPVGSFIQAGNADSVFVGADPLCHHVHGNLTQVQIGPHPRRSRNARMRKHLQHQLLGKGTGIQLV